MTTPRQPIPHPVGRHVIAWIAHCTYRALSTTGTPQTQDLRRQRLKLTTRAWRLYTGVCRVLISVGPYNHTLTHELFGSRRNQRIHLLQQRALQTGIRFSSSSSHKEKQAPTLRLSAKCRAYKYASPRSVWHNYAEKSTRLHLSKYVKCTTLFCPATGFGYPCSPSIGSDCVW